MQKFWYKKYKNSGVKNSKILIVKNTKIVV